MSHKLLNRGGGGIGWELSVNRNVGWFGNRNLFLHEMALGVWYHSFPPLTPNLVYWCSFNIHIVYLSLGLAGVGILSEVTCLSMEFWLSLKDPAGLGFALQHFVCLTGHTLFQICLHVLFHASRWGWEAAAPRAGAGHFGKYHLFLDSFLITHIHTGLQVL